jgi:DNA-directed RNA polymerase subunit beta
MITDKKVFSSVPKDIISPHDLIEVQIDSYKWFLKQGLKEILEEISPITDYSDKGLALSFVDHYLDTPKVTDQQAKADNLSYEAPLKVMVKLENKVTKEIKQMEVYLGEFPLMTKAGTFIINGVERVVISQLMRSPGVFFTMNVQRRKKLFGAKIIPNRGAWFEIETDYDGAVYVRIDRKRRIPVTSLLRVFGLDTEEKILKPFASVDNGEIRHIETTLKKDLSKSRDEALIEIYKRIRPGDLATVENARELVEDMFFNFAKYDLSRVGRYKMDLRLDRSNSEELIKKKMTEKDRLLHQEDLIDILKEIIRLNNNPMATPDDIDHLGNRRVRTLGELLQNRLRIGFARMVRIIKDRMSTSDMVLVTPAQLINASPLTAAFKEFFGSSQLSQFMDQVNPLAELEHKRRLTAMGPGGLTRERATFEVRDVHPSHYGRICPIQTPEGPNIGLVGYLACYARINELGFIEAPYRKVKAGKITDEVVYLTAFEEQRHNIAHGGVLRDENGKITTKLVAARVKGEPGFIEREKIDYIDVSTKQVVSVATSLIPFVEHDDANRALMGSNMQRQAVACVKPQAPVVSTGLEKRAAQDSGQLIISETDGIIKEVDAQRVIVAGKDDKGKETTFEYPLRSFIRSNQFTCMSQKPLVMPDQKVKKGDVLADGAATENGILALGQNLLVAFLPFRGSNFEDAIVLSERVLKEDRFTSIHIEDYTCEVRDTKLGPEITTPDIPNVGEGRLKNLDEDGIVRIGAEVTSNDILVGKISPKGEADLTPEERLLRSIFGDKAREVKDTSVRLPHGKRGRIIGVKIFSRDRGVKLPTGVIKRIQVEVAQLRKASVGDKLSGRHGNKGVISTVLPEHEMPYLEDGTPVDVVLNPLGVVSRMNLGQTLETHLGWAAMRLGFRAVTPPFAGATEDQIREQLVKSGLPDDGKVVLHDGRTGLPFAQPATVGILYMMKLNHLVEDKIHMRAIGPYSLITQQPLGGKAQFGGQRFGEMEVWALEGYGASRTLQEMLTIKSDDVIGRMATYDAIIRGEKIKSPNIPSAFNVLMNEMKALCLNVDLIGSVPEYDDLNLDIKETKIEAADSEGDEPIIHVPSEEESI